MGTVSTVQIIVHVVAVLVLLASLAFLIAGLMTTGWQIATDPGTGEIHQHGLWLDYNYIVHHAATGSQHLQWTLPKLKFGPSVDGDEPHRAKPYQVTTIVLLSLSILLAIAGSVCACAAARSMYSLWAWAVTIFLAAILALAAIIYFYIEALNNRYVNTDKKLEHVIGYSYWYSVAGAIGMILAFLAAVGYAVMAVLLKRREERPQYQTDTRPKILVAKHHITSL